MSDLDRFYAQTKPDGDCLVWTGRRLVNGGYGVFNIDGTQVRAHRWILERKLGRKLGKNGALHKCDNPPCVKLDHLYEGNQKQNICDAITRGRWKPRVKFTTAQIDDMRTLYDHGESQNSIAVHFKTDQGTVSAIVNGLSRAVSGDVPVRHLRAMFKMFGFEVDHVAPV